MITNMLMMMITIINILLLVIIAVIVIIIIIIIIIINIVFIIIQVGLAEIARVLEPGATVVLSTFRTPETLLAIFGLIQAILLLPFVIIVY